MRSWRYYPRWCKRQRKGRRFTHDWQGVWGLYFSKPCFFSPFLVFCLLLTINIFDFLYHLYFLWVQLVKVWLNISCKIQSYMLGTEKKKVIFLASLLPLSPIKSNSKVLIKWFVGLSLPPALNYISIDFKASVHQRRTRNSKAWLNLFSPLLSFSGILQAECI